MARVVGGNWIILIPVALIVVLVPVAVVIGLNSGNDNTTEKPTPAASSSNVAGVGAPTPEGVYVKIVEFGFDPKELHTPVNEPLTWHNNGRQQHTVNIEGEPGSGPLDPGANFIWTPSQPGTYSYKCIIHPNLMTGTIVVEKG